MSERFHDIAITVNGEKVRERVDARKTLVDFLRDDLALTGSHVGCEHGVCGACTVLVDGEPVRSCLMLAVACDERAVETIEGFAGDPVIAALRRNFHQHHALQCGFCTPGILCSVTHFLREVPAPDERQVRDMLSGHICRCTGYASIVAAVLDAATALRKGP